MSETQTLVPGRSCDGCTLCCKVMNVPPLNKPKSVWCPHCAIGKGCKIYDTRPQECRGFYCGYRQIVHLGEHWFPADSKMIVLWEQMPGGGERMGIHVDPGSPAAWRKEPFYSEIKQMARAGVGAGRSVAVVVGNRAIAILPDEDVDLGHVSDDEVVTTFTVRNAAGDIVRMYAEKQKATPADRPTPPTPSA